MMRRSGVRMMMLLAALLLVAAACGDSDADPTTPTAAAPATTEAPASTDLPAGREGSIEDIAITEVVFGDHVTITNTGSGDVNIADLWLCNRPNYTPLPSQTLVAGESVEIAASALGGLPDGGGEAALYTSNSFGDSSAIFDYVAWGSGGGRESVAVDAAIWPGGTVTVTGAAIIAPAGGSTPADWS